MIGMHQQPNTIHLLPNLLKTFFKMAELFQVLCNHSITGIDYVPNY